MLPNKAFAQEEEFPSLETTLEYLVSAVNMRLLTSQYVLALEVATLILVQLETEGLGDEGGLRRLYIQDDAGNQILQLLFRMSLPEEDALRSRAVAAMIDGTDPLSEDSERHSAMIANFASASSDVGLDPSSELMQSAIGSLSHAERIARVIFGGLGLCNSFPFSTKRFCEF